MFCIAPGSDMQVGVVAQHAWSLHGVILILLREFLQRIGGFLIDQIALLNPAFESAGGSHTRKAFLAIEHFDAHSIFYVADAVINGSSLVSQPGLRRRHVSHL